MLTLGIIVGIVLLQAVVSMCILDVSSSVTAAVVFAVIGMGIVVLAAKALSSALSYQNNGLAVNGGKITAYYGGFTRNVTVFHAKNLISAEDVTTPLRKKAGITSLVMHLKTNALSNEIKVHVQEESLAEKMEQLLIL